MPQRKTGNINYVRLSKLKYASSKFKEVYVVNADNKILQLWDDDIQKPYINKISSRVDKGWNWPLFKNTHYIFSLFSLQKPIIMAIGMKYKQKFVPLGLVFMAAKYPALHDNQQESSFIWYLATTPEQYLLDLGIDKHEIPSVGKLCIDIGVTTSYKSMNYGNIGLHADPKGAESLLQFYNSCNLMCLNETAKLTKLRHIIGNDGRYYYLDESNAYNFSRTYDYLR